MGYGGSDNSEGSESKESEKGKEGKDHKDIESFALEETAKNQWMEISNPCATNQHSPHLRGPIDIVVF